jgi:hypothetical protein
MINKLLWTRKEPRQKIRQFEFELPTGFKVFTIEELSVSKGHITSVDLGVKIKSIEPITLVFTPTIYSTDFCLINPVLIIPPKQEIDLNLLITNPSYDNKFFELEKEFHIANMVVVNTSYTNLIELNNKQFENK